MAALAAAAATVTPDALQQLQERYPEEDARKLFALCASKKGNVAEAAAVYEVTIYLCLSSIMSCHTRASVRFDFDPWMAKRDDNGGNVRRLLIR